MISLSHWGIFDSEQTIPFGAPPIGMIAEIYRIKKAMEAHMVRGRIIVGTELRMIKI